MKKLVCGWLDSNIMGGIAMDNGTVQSCCSAQISPLIKNADFSKITKEEFQNARIALFEAINNGSDCRCKGCPQLVSKEEEDIDIGKIDFFPLSVFYTCNFNCKYCGLPDEELNKKINKSEAKILPVIKNFHEQDLLKENFSLGLTGGEPVLLEDIPETLEYIGKHFESAKLTLFSNSSITERVEKLAPLIAKAAPNVKKTLLTSLDAGTPETYKNVRGKDLFFNTLNNIITYAENKSFDIYELKYIFQMDFSNISDDDIFGYLNFVKLLVQNYASNVRIVIDRDSSYDVNKGADEKILRAAAKIYYAADKILNIPTEAFGSSWNVNIPAGKKDLETIRKYAQEYQYAKKSLKENYYLKLLSAKNELIPEWESWFEENQKEVEKFISENKYKRVCFYGAGLFADKILKRFDFSQMNILGFVDRDPKKKGSNITDYRIYSINDLEELKPDIVILSLITVKEAKDALSKLKKEKGYDYEIVDNLFKNSFSDKIKWN